MNIIVLVRGLILDSDPAQLYGAEARRLNEQVRRNMAKFPEDFMFQLTKEEFDDLKSQIATSSPSWGGRRKVPLVFTEHGALQAANVLDSEQVGDFDCWAVYWLQSWSISSGDLPAPGKWFLQCLGLVRTY